MSDLIEVKLDFINKKGQMKHVKFFMDKITYNVLQDPSIEESVRHQYLIDEYHEYEREKFYRRKFVSFDIEMAESLDLLSDDMSHKDSSYDDAQKEKIYKALACLTERQREIVRYLYWDGKSQKEICDIYGIKKQAVSDSVKRIKMKLRKLFKN